MKRKIWKLCLPIFIQLNEFTVSEYIEHELQRTQRISAVHGLLEMQEYHFHKQMNTNNGDDAATET